MKPSEPSVGSSAGSRAFERRGVLAIVAGYALFASLWILLSDRALEALFSDPAQITRVSTLKGWGFVGVTSALLYGLIRRLAARLESAVRREHDVQEDRLRALNLLDVIAESSEDAIFAKDAKGRYLLFNQAAARFAGATPAQVLGRDDRTMFGPEDAALIMDNDRQVMAEGRTLTFEEPLTTTSGERVFLATKGPLRDAQGQAIGMFGVSRDITERKNAERRLRRTNRALRTLTYCNEALVRATEESELLLEVCRGVVEQGGYRMAWVAHAELDEQRTLRPLARAGHDDGFLESTKFSWGEHADGDGSVGRAVRERRTVVGQDLRCDPDWAHCAGAATRRGYASAIALPLLLDSDRVLGALNIFSDGVGAFDADEVRFLNDLAIDLSRGIRVLRDRAASEQAEALLRQMSAIAHVGAWKFDLATERIEWSEETYRLYGVSPESFDHTVPSFLRLLHEDDHAAMSEWIRACIAGETPATLEFRVLADGADPRILAGHGRRECDAEGRPLRLVGTVQDISARKHAESTLAIQTRVLEQVATGASLEQTLNNLAADIEAMVPGMMASILLLDEDGLHLRHGAAPSLPAAFMTAIDGERIGDRAGSCGTAMWRREPVIVEDIATDPLWDDYRDLALSFGLRACWSSPILGPSGEVLGSFALYYHAPSRPSARQRRLIELATHAGAIAIARDRSEQALRESEIRFRATFEQAAVGAAMVAIDGRWLRVNQKLCEIVAYPADELQATDFQSITHPDDLDTDLALMARMLSGEISSTALEKRYLRKSRSLVWVRLSVSLVRDESGEPDYFIAIIEDIDARKQAEQALQQSELRFRLASAHGQVWDWDIALGRGTFPGEFFRRLGYTTQDGESPLAMLESVMHPQDVPRWHEALRGHLRRRRPYDIEFRARSSTGKWFWFSTTGQAVWDASGRATYMAGTTFDITERKLAEAALAQSEAKLRLFFDLPFIGMAVTAPRSKQWLDVNQSLCDILGYTREELITRTWEQLLHPEDRAENMHQFECAMAGEIDGYKLEMRFVRGDGRVIQTLTDVKCVRNEFGEVDFFVSTLDDISERVAAQAERDALRQRLVSILDGISDGFMALDHDWRFNYVNLQGTRILGREREMLLGESLWTLFPESVGTAFQAAFERAVRENTTVILEEYFAPWDRWFETRAHPYEDGLSVFFQDVTDRQRAEAQLRRYADRLQGLSRRLLAVQEEEKRALARELHDEFGQSLAALKINLYSAKKRIDDADTTRRLGECIAIAENVIIQIRDRALDLRPSVLDDLGLAAALEWFVERQSALGGCGYSLRMENLAHRFNPELEITVFRIVQEAVNNARRHGGAQNIAICVGCADVAIEVSITDDGCGFDVARAQMRSREGGGIGLPGMQERAELLGGTLAVSSAPAQGTRISAKLPWRQ